MPKRDIAGFPTYWTGFGHGPRPALLVHCSLAQSGAYGAMLGPLSGALNITAMDLPGHGRSGPWAEDETREIQAVSTAMAAGLLPREGRVDLIGHSFGATVVLRLAVEHPERVRSLTLIEPVFFHVAFADDPALEPAYLETFRPFIEAWNAGDRAAATEAFVAFWGIGLPWAQIPEPQRAEMIAQIHLIPAASDALERDVGGILLRLSAIKAPVLLIEGADSIWIMPRILSGLAGRLRDATRAVIAGAGHMVPFTHPDQVAREILALVQRS